MWIKYKGYAAPLAPPVTCANLPRPSDIVIGGDGTLFFFIEGQDDEYGPDDDEDQAIEFSRVMPSCAWEAKETADAAAQLGLTIDQSLVRAFEATHYDTVDSPMFLLTIDEFRELPHAGSLGNLADARLALQDRISKVTEHAKKCAADTNKLTELTVSVAEAIANGTGDIDGLYLNGLAELSDDVASVLGCNRGYDYIVLDGLHSLSATSAASLARGYKRLYLNGISELPIEVAEVFAKYKGNLHLNGLTALDDAVATLLSQAGPLSLDGVSFLTGTQADALAKAAGTLSLEGLRALESVPLARVLAKQRLLRLANLSQLSDEAADQLAKQKGSLRLDGLGALTVAAANALARYKGDCLSLGGLRTLSDDVAAVLGACKSARLLLNGVESLGGVGAESLARIKGNLRLDGLKTLSPETAAGLSQKKKGYLLLNGLTELPESLAASFRGCTCNLDFNGVTVLSDPVAAVLASTKGDLELNGVTEVSAASADALARKPKGDLMMDGLLSISSIALAKRLGKVCFATKRPYADFDGLVLARKAVCRPAFVKRWSAAEHTLGFMDFISIPAGSFTMGSPEKEEGRSANENQVPVTITRAFELGKTVVTQKQWTEVMGTDRWNWEDLKETGDNYPAVYISWDDASLFCEYLTSYEREAGRLSEKQTYRLPTEAEWEYACRAGTTTAYSYGDAESKLGDYAWCDKNSEGNLHEVATKKPNPWGFFDMHGNVWEWCEDWYEGSLSGGNDPKGPSAGSYRVIRGGFWDFSAPYCRSAFRSRYVPEYRDCRSGFRIVRVLL